MNAGALALVIAGAFLHALWNLAAKKASGGLPFVWLFGLVSLVFIAPVGVWFWLRDPRPINGAALSAVLASVGAHIAYSLVLQKGYQQSDFSLVYPLARGTGPLFSVFGAMTVLGELPSALGWSGIGCILIGIFLISGTEQLLRAADDRLLKGVMWGGLTGLCIAAYTVIDGWAVKALGMSPPVYYALGLALRSTLLAPFALRDTRALRDQWRMNGRHVFAVGILSPLAYTLVLFAVKRAPLSYVAPAREVSMLIGAVLGAQLLREQNVRSRMVGTALMLLGVVLLARA
ncbi:MAG: DMT family transporter [Candidatus Sumerlaeota bacterium]|nr:DMT family transporter [Candidatus Sumerlaeota bacterium]